jgi:FKBP-type peptidyl-prolyl cis-trans isomerase SlyD
MQIEDNCVVSIHYRLTNDSGELLDASAEGAPLAYLHGAEGIIPKLERELSGKAPGDAFKVKILAAEGYGERRDDLVQDVPRQAFPESAEISPGMVFSAQSEDGQSSQNFTVVSVAETTVKVDGNHPLAGVTLHFEGTIHSVRPATDEEKAHGHPH